MAHPPRRFLRLAEVKYQVGLGRTAIYQKIKAGEFPKPYSLGVRAVGWFSEDIEEWIDSRIHAAEAVADSANPPKYGRKKAFACPAVIVQMLRCHPYDSVLASPPRQWFATLGGKTPQPAIDRSLREPADTQTAPGQIPFAIIAKISTAIHRGNEMKAQDMRKAAAGGQAAFLNTANDTAKGTAPKGVKQWVRWLIVGMALWGLLPFPVADLRTRHLKLGAE